LHQFDDHKLRKDGGELMKTNTNKRSIQAGFTLVEIAIVLVIIGLLLGGILKGQEMTTQAKIKNVINDLNGVTAALNAYQDRYKALPGDDKNAATRWTSASPAPTPGNGDGVIQGFYNSVTAADESVQFWLDLRLAGFLSGTGTDQPFNASSGKMGVQAGDGAGGAVLGTVGPPAVPGFTGLILCTANLPDKIAISVDSQMDDGDGTKGSVRGQLGTGNPPVNAASTAYVEDGTKSYLVCRTMI
jgi:prepilin-type N-terminal cleavage/methylation domain-containing protein